MSKISEHFDVREFVPPEIWNAFGENSQWFVRPEIVRLAEFIRNHFGKPMTINNWHTGGIFHYRGFRPRSCNEGAELSQHRICGAIDFNIEGLTDDEVYDEIIKNEAAFMAAGLTTLEDKTITKGWTHGDMRWTGLSHILTVKP